MKRMSGKRRSGCGRVLGVRDLSCDIKKCMDGHFKEVRDIRKEDSMEKL